MSLAGQQPAPVLGTNYYMSFTLCCQIGCSQLAPIFFDVTITTGCVWAMGGCMHLTSFPWKLFVVVRQRGGIEKSSPKLWCHNMLQMKHGMHAYITAFGHGLQPGLETLSNVADGLQQDSSRTPIIGIMAHSSELGNWQEASMQVLHIESGKRLLNTLNRAPAASWPSMSCLKLSCCCAACCVCMQVMSADGKVSGEARETIKEHPAQH